MVVACPSLDTRGWLGHHVLHTPPDRLHTADGTVRKVQIFLNLVRLSVDPGKLLCKARDEAAGSAASISSKWCRGLAPPTH
jgi:hypothetical protein